MPQGGFCFWGYKMLYGDSGLTRYSEALFALFNDPGLPFLLAVTDAKSAHRIINHSLIPKHMTIYLWASQTEPPVNHIVIFPFQRFVAITPWRFLSSSAKATNWRANHYKIALHDELFQAVKALKKHVEKRGKPGAGGELVLVSSRFWF